MPTYASNDAEQVAHGIRLGGKAAMLDDFLRSMNKPVSVDQLEYITRPDAYAEHGLRATPDDRFEHVGMLKISATQHGYSIAAEWFGWLPGSYTTRDAALTAYGYVLGGEAHGYLEDIAKRYGGSITTEDLQAIAAG
jgi:hypothetical protein